MTGIMKDLDFFTGMINAGVLGCVIAFVSATVSLTFFGMIAYTIVKFINLQFRFIVSLYTKFIDETSMYHVYTRSILNNSCPELSELRTLQAMPRTPENVEKMTDILDGIITTLEMKESNNVKNTLVSQFKSIRRRVS